MHIPAWMEQLDWFAMVCCVCCLPQGIGKCHYRIANELQLILKVSVLPREALLGGAGARIVVVGCAGAARVAALKVVLPEFCKSGSVNLAERISPGRTKAARTKRDFSYPRTRDCAGYSPRSGLENIPRNHARD